MKECAVYKDSRELTRVAARVSIPHTSFCFKREATRVLLSSKLSREYEVEKSSVKRENANASKTRLGKGYKTQGYDTVIDSKTQESESLVDHRVNVQQLLQRTTKNMNFNYVNAKQRRHKMDDLEWRLQRIFKRLERRTSRKNYQDTVKSVRKLDRKYQFIFVNNYEELWSIKG